MAWLAQLLERNSGEPRARLELGALLHDQLALHRLPPDSALLNDFADLAVQWMSASNFKVALLSFDLLETSVAFSGEVISPYLLERAAAVIERLGDSKASVRDAATALLIQLAYAPRSTPQLVLEKVQAGFNHRQWLVRTGSMGVFTKILEASREDVEAQAYRFIPLFCKLLMDPNAEVRDYSAKTLAHVISVLGPSVEQHIHSRQLLPDSKLSLLSARAREVSIKSLAAAVSSSSALRHHYSAVPSPLSLNGSNRPSTAGVASSSLGMFREPRLPAAPGRVGAREEEQENQRGLGPRQHSAGSAAGMRRATPLKATSAPGTVNEDDFRKSFHDVPKEATVYSAKELSTQMEIIRGILADDKHNDWDKRVKNLKKMRSLVINGGREFEETLVAEINLAEDAFLVSVKDLRSQVCREACLTLSFFCEELQSSMVRVCEAVLPPLIQLIMNSAKVMASSATLACIFIIRNVQHPKLVPIVLAGKSSKSKEIRGQVLYLVGLLLEWDAKRLDKSLPQLIDAIRAGLGDADPAARTSARLAYAKLDAAFPKQAQVLFQSLDATRQRALAGSVSQSSSSQSIVSEHDNLPLTHRPGGFGLLKQKAYYTGRSTSDIDATAARRANAFTPSRRILGNGAPIGLAATRRTPVRTGLPPSRPTPTTQRGNSITSSAMAGTVSQPTSRSTSPQSRIPNPRKKLTPTGVAPRKSNNNLSRDSSPRRGSSGSDVHEAIRRLTLDRSFDDIDSGRRSIGSPSSRMDTAALTDAMRACQSAGTEKRDGISSLHACIRSGAPLDSVWIRKITDLLNKLISEGNHKVLTAMLDMLASFVEVHGSQLVDWLPTLLNKLLMKAGSEVIPGTKALWMSSLKMLRSQFDVEVQLIAMCKNIRNPVTSPPVKVKGLMLHYLHELLSPCDRQIRVNHEEVRAALGRIFSWKDDPKHAPIKSAMDQFLVDLFNANEADYTSIVDTLPPNSRDYALNICQNGRVSSVREGISEMTAQINDFVDRSSSLPPLLQSSPSPSISRSPASLHPTSPLATANGNSYQHRPSFTPSETDSTDSFLRGESTTMSLMHNHAKQQEFITSALRTLSSPSTSPEDRLPALSSLLQMVSEGSFTLWETNFKPLILCVFEIISGAGDDGLKRNALKLLSRMCLAQASRFYEFAEMSVLKVLSATIGDANAQVQHVADECGKTLATHLPAPFVVRALNPIVGEDGDPRRGSAVKMLTRLLEALDCDELMTFIADVVPGVVKAFMDNSSAVRKSVVLCLATLHNKVGGEPLRPYLVGLDSQRLKLIEVYVQRAQTASNHF